MTPGLIASIVGGASRRRPASTAGGGGSPVTVTTFQVTSTPGGSSLPFTLHHSFAEGDVPSASVAGLGGDSSLQVSPQTYWADGSLKGAIISGVKTLSAATPSTITLQKNGTVASGSTLGTTELKATSITASIAYGAYGTVSWATTDWDSPFATIVSGPAMSSWTYRKAIGSDTHLVGWLEVRLYSGGNVEVMAWIENCYLNVASPGARTGTATFTLGGSSRFSANLDLLNHGRAVLASGWPFSFWLGTAPEILPKHGASYLMNTKLVPNYRADSTGSSALSARLTTSYTPLATADVYDPMHTAGYHEHIGLLGEHDAAYLTRAGDATSYKAVVCNALSSGRYGIHYRDEATNRPLLFASHTTKVAHSSSGMINIGGASSGNLPSASGTTPPEWDVAHHPSFGFMAYLLTGWNYFLEESQFVATGNYLNYGDTERGGASGIFKSQSGTGITRGAAWAIRSLAQAACITPDADTAMRASFVASLNANIDHYHGRYVASTVNALGLVEPYNDSVAYGGTPGGPWRGAVWMDDFFTAVCGYAKELKAATSTSITNLDAFCAWKYKSIVGRLGGYAQFSYRYAEQYYTLYATTDSNAWTSSTGFYADWTAVAVAMSLANDASPGSKMVGTYAELATGYTSNYMPALAYAVDHGAAGAADAYDRIRYAANFTTHIATYTDDPVWGVKPRTVADPALPTYLAAIGSTLAWTTISNTVMTDAMSGYSSPGGTKNYICSYSGGALSYKDNTFHAWGGGHNDYGGNEKPEFYAGANTPSWLVRRNPSATNQDGTAVNPDGTPKTRHSYSGVHVDDVDSRLLLLGGALYYSAGLSTNRVDAIELDDDTFVTAGTYPSDAVIQDLDFPCCKDQNGDIWAKQIGGSFLLKKLDRATKTWTSYGGKNAISAGSVFVEDPINKRILQFNTGSHRWYDYSGNESTLTISGAASANIKNSVSAFWCASRESILVIEWGGNVITELVHSSGSTYTATVISMGGSAPATGGDAVNNFHGRFFYAPYLKTAYLVRNAEVNVVCFMT